jgi:hypothetical protein
MRVEHAIEEARALIAQGQYNAARRTLEPHATHPKAQYWLQRLEKSAAENTGGVAQDRMFTFSWNTLLAVGIIVAFGVVIVVIGVTV